MQVCKTLIVHLHVYSEALQIVHTCTIISLLHHPSLLQGAPGFPGYPGEPGLKGEKGPQGVTGAIGWPGPTGFYGLKGPQGKQGAPGERVGGCVQWNMAAFSILGVEF